METRNQRAWRDAKPWRFSPKDVAFSVVTAGLAFVAELVFGHGASLPTLGIAVGVGVVAAVLIPAVVYAVSWATAVGRIHGDELKSLRTEIEEVRTALISRRRSSALLDRLKELKAIGGLLNRRVPPFGPTPEGQEEDLSRQISEWAAEVSDALIEVPTLKAQFDAATDENSLLAALKANPLSIRLQNRTSSLDDIIKYLSSLESPPK